MPPRKEPKETVVYPASKRRPPPFKPLRPSKAPRSTVTESSTSSVRSQSNRRTHAPKAAERVMLVDSEDEEDDSDDNNNHSKDDGIESDSSGSEDLPDLPPPSKFANANGRPVSTKPFKPPPAKRKPARQVSDISIALRDSPSSPAPSQRSSPPLDASEPSSQLHAAPAIPQPLLVRLLHERFQDKSMKIDKHAIQVVQKYIDIFVREAIARTALAKQDEAAAGQVGTLEGKWLELEDLEKIAPGLMMDF